MTKRNAFVRCLLVLALIATFAAASVYAADAPAAHDVVHHPKAGIHASGNSGSSHAQ